MQNIINIIFIATISGILIGDIKVVIGIHLLILGYKIIGLK